MLLLIHQLNTLLWIKMTQCSGRLISLSRSFLPHQGEGSSENIWGSLTRPDVTKIWGVPQMGVPKIGWFIRENHIEMDDDWR